MESTELLGYRRLLKRKNCSDHTVRNYLNILTRFAAWLKRPMQEVRPSDGSAYTEHLLRRKRKPKTINCHLGTIRLFFDYRIDEEKVQVENPVKKGFRLRVPKPLPRHLKDGQVVALFKEIKDARDRAMFMLMLRCGLRVEEVARLTTHAIEFNRRQIFAANGKGSKDRVVYASEDTRSALKAYLKKRSSRKAKGLFLVQKGPMKGKPISVRGIRWQRSFSMPMPTSSLSRTSWDMPRLARLNATARFPISKCRETTSGLSRSFCNGPGQTEKTSLNWMKK
jgi:site-specific recombinase XerD